MVICLNGVLVTFPIAVIKYPCKKASQRRSSFGLTVQRLTVQEYSLSKQESHESRSLRPLVSIASIVRKQKAMNFCAQLRNPLLYNPGSHSRKRCHNHTVGGSSASLIKIIPTAVLKGGSPR